MAKKDKATEAPTTETVEQPPVPQGQGLNLSDIRACVSIIDIVTKRGAFEGSELADVGAVRNRIDSFLAKAAAAQEAANPTEAPATAE